MSSEVSLALLEAYSWGEVSRRDTGAQLGEEVSFGDLFGALLEHGLRLSRLPVHPDSPGVRLIEAFARRATRAG